MIADSLNIVDYMEQTADALFIFSRNGSLVYLYKIICNRMVQEVDLIFCLIDLLDFSVIHGK